jgi:hypothetical protein
MSSDEGQVVIPLTGGYLTATRLTHGDTRRLHIMVVAHKTLLSFELPVDKAKQLRMAIGEVLPETAQ